MKLVGFITEHTDSKFSKKFKEYKINLLNPRKKEILKCLKNGEIFAVSMNLIECVVDNEIIGGSAYRTSGNWIWPDYLSYYFEKYNIEIQEDFLDYLINTNGKNIFNSSKAISFLIDHKVLGV